MMKVIIFIIMLNINIFILNKLVLMQMMTLMMMMISLIFMYSINFNENWMNLYSWLGMDLISYILVLLSIWIIMMMFIVSINIHNNKMFSIILLLLLLMLMLSFLSINYFMFYLYFEISLFPTFLLIMGWGYQPERINASMFMLLYTMFASLPMLIIIFNLFNYFNSLSYMIIMNNFIKYNYLSFIMYMYMILAFLVKLPMFLFHMWLPKAHVEAPVSGSMILAGIMLKLGGYGIYRSMMMMINYSKSFNYISMTISLIGMLVLSMVCLRQYDMKLLVAYSSVIHMGMMLLGMMSMNIWGKIGGYMMMVAHGLCSSALFVLVNLLYEQTKSRNLFINKGMIIFYPTLSMWWFLFCICNMSSPISLNLLSEIMIINILLNWSMNIIIILMISMYLSAMYSLYLFSYSQHGLFNNMMIKLKFNNINNYILLLLHWIPLNLIIMKIELFM
uniref:NADH-ubiquinone oxidoreductase chain 4 n=1 Tax=Pteromalus puparum TaxID=32389 RepID=A0A3G2BYZ2_9HYME|nr:NADH dehydrogenase subunit 4 [Pteromalus puparum]AYM35230.1 NADH dehydrogenase subunit 4 [Pteromalus puparum]AZL93472.1 NADH dehydrogenase subunit 4 [Pteromalus puparum]